MTIGLKEFQETAIEQLVKSVSELLAKDASNKVCVFQSPTGSGKTVMVAKFVEEIIKELPKTDLCFLWVSIGKGDLHKQSKKSLERIFDGFPNVNLLEEEFFGSRNYIEQNEVVVVNWEKLYNKYNSGEQKGEWKNKVMRDGEGVNFIEVLETTREKHKIILIIDESHYASDAQRTSELRKIISADVTLEMSATPKIQPSMQDQAKGIAKFVYVDPKDVIEEGMIKKELIINENLEKLVDDEKTSQDIIIEAAYNKRLELKEAYTNAGSNINPLCLIQLPNAEAGVAKKEVIEAFLADKGITETNGKLAVWLSEEKSDGLDVISDFESEVEFLLFKQAIDTGWDCPRAHILVKLRDIQSYTFEVQTVGRILRMPEQMHYEDENLNTGFIFTNLQKITVQKEDYNPNIIKHLKSVRKPIYKPLLLPSYYKSRVDFGDITFSFGKILEEVFCKAFDIEINPIMVNTAENGEKIKAKGLTTEITTYKESLLTDKNIKGIEFDQMLGDLNDSDDRTTLAKLADNDLQDMFSSVVKENLSGFAPKRSVPTVRGAIYLWFKKYLGINYQMENGIIHIQYLFMHYKNLDKFSELLSKATGEYKPIKKAEVKAKIEETVYDWDIKKEEFFNQHTDEKLDYKLCIYEPCYLAKDRSTPEKEFEKHLETKEDKIEWWFKNGVSKKDFFGIKYEENDLPQTFYTDYIIQLASGKTFIGDTKAGSTATEAKSRAEALQAYIKDQNTKGKNLIGGIIIKDDTKKWRVNQQDEYLYDKNDLTKWEYFDNII
ncbi:MAG TPA: DEAD/DEAH box helicase family protein [Chitinophagales bacterium]|nr:DEAD/DEAH box helicase family protein [Chitinophagales bacterium]